MEQEQPTRYYYISEIEGEPSYEVHRTKDGWKIVREMFGEGVGLQFRERGSQQTLGEALGY